MKLCLSVFLASLAKTVLSTSFFKLGNVHPTSPDTKTEFNWFGDCSYTSTSGYWSIAENDTRSHCSLTFKEFQFNGILTTFLTNGSSVLATFLKNSSGNRVTVASSEWITEPGWLNSTIELQLIEGEAELGAIITIFNPIGHGFSPALDNWFNTGNNESITTEPELEISEKPSKSISEQMKEVNLHLLVAVAGLILIMMVIVIIVTCIRRMCPPCKGPNVEDLDEAVDTYDEDDLLDEILDTQLRMGLHFDLPKTQAGFQVEQMSRTEPIFFSSNWASTFSDPEKPTISAQNVQNTGSAASLLAPASDLHRSVGNMGSSNKVIGFRGTESQNELVSSSSTQALVDTV